MRAWTSSPQDHRPLPESAADRGRGTVTRCPRGLRKLAAPAVAALSLALPGVAQADVAARVAQACPGAAAQPTAATLGAAEQATLCAVNAERARHDLAPMRMDSKLERASRSHGQAMVESGVFAHEVPGGDRLLSRVRRTDFGSGRFGVGEVLAWGTGRRSTPAETVEAWMKSDGHREIILTGRFRFAGPAIVPGVPKKGAGSAGATYTMDVGWK
jgi:uncharacterized protein YkwD